MQKGVKKISVIRNDKEIPHASDRFGIETMTVSETHTEAKITS
jgi:hypothetical protein